MSNAWHTDWYNAVMLDRYAVQLCCSVMLFSYNLHRLYAVTSGKVMMNTVAHYTIMLNTDTLYTGIL